MCKLPPREADLDGTYKSWIAPDVVRDFRDAGEPFFSLELAPPFRPSLLIRFAPPLPGPPAQYHHRIGILVDIVDEFVVGLFMPSRRRKRERPKNG